MLTVCEQQERANVGCAVCFACVKVLGVVLIGCGYVCLTFVNSMVGVCVWLKCVCAEGDM